MCLTVDVAELVAAGAAALDATGTRQPTFPLPNSYSRSAVALHDVKKLYNATKSKLSELKTKITSQAAAAAPMPQPPPPLLLVAAKSFAASHSIPTPQPDDPGSFFSAIEALISVLERNLAEARSQATIASNDLKTPTASPKSQNLKNIGSAKESSNVEGLSRLSISPIVGGVGASASAEPGSGDGASLATFASMAGSGAFTSPKKAAFKQPSFDPASSSASASSAASLVSAATTAPVVDTESFARIQLHNIDLQRRVERLQMSMKVTARYYILL